MAAVPPDLRLPEAGRLELWPMSSSYPATTGYLETRALLKTLTMGKRDTEVVLGDNMEVEDDKDKTRGKSIKDIFQNCFPEETSRSNEDVEDVDGVAEDLVKPVVKLVFLKILVVDIGISLGDVITDFMQGISLVFDSDWNIQWNTYHYGLAILITMWIPAIIAAGHFWGTKRRGEIFGVQGNLFWKSVCLTLFIIFFPLIPSLLYLQILIKKRRFLTNREKLKYLDLENTTHCLKGITGGVQSPLQVIILLWLMIRGILTFPWTNTPSYSCVEDSLPVASIIFSTLSIIKSIPSCGLHHILHPLHHKVYPRHEHQPYDRATK